MKIGILIGGITLILNVGVSFVAGGVLLVAMNGYREDDAAPGLLTYLTLSVIASILIAVASMFTFRKLISRDFGVLAASLLSIVAMWIVCVGAVFVSFFIGIVVAETMRRG